MKQGKLLLAENCIFQLKEEGVKEVKESPVIARMTRSIENLIKSGMMPEKGDVIEINILEKDDSEDEYRDFFTKIIIEVISVIYKINTKGEIVSTCLIVRGEIFNRINRYDDETFKELDKKEIGRLNKMNMPIMQAVCGRLYCSEGTGLSLEEHGIETFGQLLSLKYSDFLKIKGIGVHKANDIAYNVKRLHLILNMNVDLYIKTGKVREKDD